MADSLAASGAREKPLRDLPTKCPTLVETSEIRGYSDTLPTEESRTELKKYLYDLVDRVVSSADNRDDRQKKFDEIVRDGEGLIDDAKPLFELIKGREATHIYVMSAVAWPELYKLHYKEDFPFERRAWHDHSKDLMFMFVMAANFDLKVGHEALPNMVEDEFKRHYTLEPHHPEFEKHTGKECVEIDIFEMAVDRMSRNVQFSNGKVDAPRMRKFAPKFFLGDVEKKEEIYWSFVDKYGPNMEEIWQRTYGDQLKDRSGVGSLGRKRKSEDISDTEQEPNEKKQMVSSSVAQSQDDTPN